MKRETHLGWTKLRYPLKQRLKEFFMKIRFSSIKTWHHPLTRSMWVAWVNEDNEKLRFPLVFTTYIFCKPNASAPIIKKVEVKESVFDGISRVAIKSIGTTTENFPKEVSDAISN